MAQLLFASSFVDPFTVFLSLTSGGINNEQKVFFYFESIGVELMLSLNHDPEDSCAKLSWDFWLSRRKPSLFDEKACAPVAI